MIALALTLSGVFGTLLLLAGIYFSGGFTSGSAPQLRFSTVKQREGLVLDSSDRDSLWGRYQKYWWDQCTNAGYSPTLGEYFGYGVIAASALFGVFSLLIVGLPILSVFVCALPPFGASVFLGAKGRSRSVLMETQLGAFLSSVGVGVETGAQPVTALLGAIRETSDPLRTELSYLAASLNNNVPAKDALAQLRKITPNKFLKELCSNMILALADGSDVSKSIEILGKNVRVNAKMRGDIKSKTAESRIGSVGMLLCVPLGLALSWSVNDDPKATWNSPVGIVVLLMALGLGGLAAFIANKQSQRLESL